MKELLDAFVQQRNKRRFPTERDFHFILNENFFYIKHQKCNTIILEKEFIYFIGVQIDNFHTGLDFMPVMGNYSKSIKAIYIIGINSVQSDRTKHSNFPDLEFIKIDISNGMAPSQIVDIRNILNAYESKITYSNKEGILKAANKIDASADLKFIDFDNKILRLETRNKRIKSVAGIMFFIFVILFYILYDFIFKK